MVKKFFHLIAMFNELKPVGYFKNWEKKNNLHEIL